MNPIKFCSCYIVESLEANLFREHKDRVGEGRALYNLGNVFHAKGKENLLGQNCSSLSKDLSHILHSFLSLWLSPGTALSLTNLIVMGRRRYLELSDKSGHWTSIWIICRAINGLIRRPNTKPLPTRLKLMLIFNVVLVLVILDKFLDKGLAIKALLILIRSPVTFYADRLDWWVFYRQKPSLENTLLGSCFLGT